MSDLLLVIGILPVIFMIYCARKYDQISLPYKTFNIFGDFKAYLFTNFSLVAIVGIICACCYVIFSKAPLDYGQLGMFIILSIIGIVVAILTYRSAADKCPEGPLKDKLAWSMFVTGIGKGVDALIFFIKIVDEITKPEKAVDENGRTIYIFNNGNVYDEHGNLIGKKSEFNTNTYFRKK